MSENQKPDLLEKYLCGTASADEMAMVDEWLDHLESNNEWSSFSEEERRGFVQKLYSEIRTDIQPEPKIISLNRKFPWLAAASIILIAVAGIWFWNAEKNTHSVIDQPIAQQQGDILPGGNKAFITLANGSKIALDSATSGIISRQNGTMLMNSNGLVSYNSEKISASEIQYNTISTPRGGQYSILLNDGTRVWLNAESSLKFPVVFMGGSRIVEMEGECYFEVSHNGKPFIVKNGNKEIRVLGTEFNVNSYAGEAFAVTLLKGAVSFSQNNEKVLLRPGQQAMVKNNSIVINDNVDTDDVMAWKNGYFSFRDAGIRSIMSSLSRWYDFDVVYEGMVPSVKFSGEIERNLTLEQVLDILQQTRIHFELKGNKLIIHSKK